MNREIKFRAWLKDKKKMIDVRAIDFDGKGVFSANYPEGKSYCGYDRDNIELMQYTGLKDKNGKEIYEGDVFIDEECCVGIVRYSEQFAWFIIDWYESPHSKEPIDTDPLGDINIHNMEAIGNIYENPELLGVEDEQ